MTIWPHSSTDLRANQGLRFVTWSTKQSEQDSCQLRQSLAISREHTTQHPADADISKALQLVGQWENDELVRKIELGK